MFFKFVIVKPIRVLFWVCLWVFSAFGVVVSVWQLNLYCTCVQIAILRLYTVVTHSFRFLPKLIAIKFKLMSFELEEGEISPYSELACGLEQALGRIQQLEAVVYSECQSWLAAEAANQQI